MVRIAGVNIQEEKKVLYALTKIYGIGLSSAFKILNQAKIDLEKRTKDLKPQEIKRIKEIIEKNYKIEGEVRGEVLENIKRLKEIGCWRGIRHLKGLPVRGQTTRRNSRTIRGNIRRTMSSGKRKPPAPK